MSLGFSGSLGCYIVYISNGVTKSSLVLLAGVDFSEFHVFLLFHEISLFLFGC